MDLRSQHPCSAQRCQKASLPAVIKECCLGLGSRFIHNNALFHETARRLVPSFAAQDWRQEKTTRNGFVETPKLDRGDSFPRLSERCRSARSRNRSHPMIRRKKRSPRIRSSHAIFGAMEIPITSGRIAKICVVVVGSYSLWASYANADTQTATTTPSATNVGRRDRGQELTTRPGWRLQQGFAVVTMDTGSCQCLVHS